MTMTEMFVEELLRKARKQYAESEKERLDWVRYVAQTERARKQRRGR
jgi:hypothetical protein